MCAIAKEKKRKTNKKIFKTNCSKKKSRLFNGGKITHFIFMSQKLCEPLISLPIKNDKRKEKEEGCWKQTIFSRALFSFGHFFPFECVFCVNFVNFYFNPLFWYFYAIEHNNKLMYFRKPDDFFLFVGMHQTWRNRKKVHL